MIIDQKLHDVKTNRSSHVTNLHIKMITNNRIINYHNKLIKKSKSCSVHYHNDYIKEIVTFSIIASESIVQVSNLRCNL